MKASTIEPMAAHEVGDVSRLLAASIKEGLASFYTPAVIEALIRGNSIEAVCGHAPKQTDYVMRSGGRIVGMIGLKRNEIGHLFIHPEETGKGLGCTLIDFARRQFQDAGHTDMVVLASLNAVGFYGRCGFTEEARGNFEVGKDLYLNYVRMTCTTEEQHARLNENVRTEE